MQHQSLILITTTKIPFAEIAKLAHLTSPISESDTFSIDTDGKSIGVANIKKLVEWSSNKPFNSQTKLGIVYDASLMTEEAQNAMLKTLEEPTADTQIILLTASVQGLLPTIRSRCQMIYLADLKSESLTKYDELAQKFYQADFIVKLDMISELISGEDHRVQAERFLDALISHLGNVAFTFSDSKIAANMLELCAIARQGLKSGTNVKLTLENLAASMKSN